MLRQNGTDYGYSRILEYTIMKKIALSLLAMFLALPLLSACEDQKQAAPAERPAPEVTVAEPLKREIIEWNEFTGRFEAVERVEIRARVSGYLDKVLFREGDLVHKGDLLYVIDQRPFRIDMQRAQAEYDLAKKEFERYERLAKTSAASRQRLDESRQQLRAAEADLASAKLNLEFTRVKAPISGLISSNKVDIGNLISGDIESGTALTTIVSHNPIHFTLEASEQQYLAYRRINAGQARPGTSGVNIPVFIKLQDEDTFAHQGALDFADNEIDESTGTILLRARLENPSNPIYPGLFGRARIQSRPAYEGLLVPDTAIGTDQSRKFVLIIGPENTVGRKFVTLGPLQDDGLRVIRSGLENTDKVIIRGLQRARPGAPVNPVEGQIGEGGAG